MCEVLTQKTNQFFKSTFGTLPQKVVLSPGRINIIGEHIDYNDGYVLPAAIDKYICFCFAKNNTNKSNIQAIDFNDCFEIDFEKLIEKSNLQWTNYIKSVCKQLQINDLYINGFDCAFSSTIPIGAGLSSSAALVCGFLYGLNALFELNLKPLQMALMGQKAEHWVGINCGIMDQFSSIMGLKDKVIKIDCKTLDFEYFDANFSDFSIVLFDTQVSHTLANTAYNLRRKQCDEGLQIIKKHFPKVHSFRDCNQIQLESLETKMEKAVFKRCLFVIKEINRVVQACIALQSTNMYALGTLMFETHEGLANEYEVSCPELDFLVQTAKSQNWSIGSRVMGGGFGGCTINLIRKNAENQIVIDMKKLYFDKFGIELKNYFVKISDGTRIIEAQI